MKTVIASTSNFDSLCIMAEQMVGGSVHVSGATELPGSLMNSDTTFIQKVLWRLAIVALINSGPTVTGGAFQ